MQPGDPVPSSPPLSEEELCRLLAIDVEAHFGLLVQTYQNEVRMLVRQLINAIQPEQIALADTIASRIFMQMYGDLKNLEAETLLEMPIRTRLDEIMLDHCFGQVVKKYEIQIDRAIEQLLDKSKLEQTQEVIALAEEIFSQVRQKLESLNIEATRGPDVWINLYNLIIAQCFEQLLVVYRPQLKSFVFKLSGDADNTQDIVQDALLNAFKFLKGHGLPNKKETFDLDGWIFQIARRVFYKSLRKTAPAGKEISINYAEEDHPVFEIEDHQNIAPDEALERDEAQKHLHKLINQLPEHYRETLQFHLAGLSNVEIARCKMVQESTVRSRIFRATKMLQERLHKEGE